jgi:hypothetical protein
MRERDITVIVFGAGATRDCGGPLTNEILPEAFKANPSLLQQQEAIDLLRRFLNQSFPLSVERREPQDYPSLPLFLSLLDTAIERKHPFGLGWPAEEVVKVREAVEAAIFAVLDFRSPQLEISSYADLEPEAAVISLNYDMILPEFVWWPLPMSPAFCT